ncbi:MAG: hypothetical protein ACI358_04595 [Candidatus Limimorpha sp.]
MSKFSTIVFQFFKDCLAVILSAAVVMLSCLIGVMLFGEGSSVLAFFVSLFITVIVGCFASAIIIRLLSKQHAVTILLLSSLLLLVYIIVSIVSSDISIIEMELDAVSGGIVGIVAAGIIEVVTFFCLVRLK